MGICSMGWESLSVVAPLTPLLVEIEPGRGEVAASLSSGLVERVVAIAPIARRAKRVMRHGLLRGLRIELWLRSSRKVCREAMRLSVLRVGWLRRRRRAVEVDRMGRAGHLGVGRN